MTAAAAWKRCLEETYDAEDAAGIWEVTKDTIDELVFHEIAAIGAKRFRVDVWIRGAKRATLWRRSEADAHASGIATSLRLA